MGNTNTPAAKKTPVTLSTRVYKRNHGAEPRGRGSWCFVMGADDFAVAEARRRGVTLIGVAP